MPIRHFDASRDRNRIDLRRDHELRYWTEQLGCTVEQLSSQLSRQVRRKGLRA